MDHLRRTPCPAFQVRIPVASENLREREEKIARSVDNAALIERRLADIEAEHSGADQEGQCGSRRDSPKDPG